MNQRPELFKVAFSVYWRDGHVAVSQIYDRLELDIGIGSSENPTEFKSLYAYSPLHNIRQGGQYPAVLITTADHDDRVVPAHSFKYAAALQAKAGGSSVNPLLLRVDINSGHGASNAKKSLETSAYLYAFMFRNMGLTWK